MSELKRSLLISFLTKYSNLVITIISSMLIARLLTPNEIGVFSIGASLIGIAHTLRDFGISNYLIQTKEINNIKIKTAFTITCSLSWIIALTLFLIKDIAADFYNKPELAIIIKILILNFIILPFSSISIALLKREMKFGTIYKITIISGLSQAITSISLASNGYSFYSLAWGGFANVATTTIAAQLTHRTISDFRFCLKEFKSIFAFGGQLSIASLANEAGNFSPDLIIGKIMNFTSVGLYSRAFGFVSIIENSITDAIRPILLPYFSKEIREGRDTTPTFVKIANCYLAIALPFLSLLALLAHPIITLLYGEQWTAAIPIARILCLSIAFKSLNFLMSSIIVSYGNVNKLLKAQVTYQLLKIGTILYSSFYSLEHVAYSLAVVELYGFFAFYTKINNSQINIKVILFLFLRNTSISIASILPAALIYLIQVNHITYTQILDLMIDNSLIKISFTPDKFNTLTNISLICTTTLATSISWFLIIYLTKHSLNKIVLDTIYHSKQKIFKKSF